MRATVEAGGMTMREISKNIIEIAINSARYVSKILATTIIIITSPLWVVPYLTFHVCDIMEGL